jgi:hypothetical protein
LRYAVTLPDGTMKSGIDVDVLYGQQIRENWTFVADGHRNEPDPGPGDSIGYDALLSLVLDWAGEHRYTVHRRSVIDAGNGRAALLRTSTIDDDVQVGGVDLLTVRGGVLEPLWSIPGRRAFRC